MKGDSNSDGSWLAGSLTVFSAEKGVNQRMDLKKMTNMTD